MVSLELNPQTSQAIIDANDRYVLAVQGLRQESPPYPPLCEPGATSRGMITGPWPETVQASTSTISPIYWTSQGTRTLM